MTERKPKKKVPKAVQELRDRQRLSRQNDQQVGWYYQHREEEDQREQRRRDRARGPFDPRGRRSQIPTKAQHPWPTKDPRGDTK